MDPGGWILNHSCGPDCDGVGESGAEGELRQVAETRKETRGESS